MVFFLNLTKIDTDKNKAIYINNMSRVRQKGPLAYCDITEKWQLIFTVKKLMCECLKMLSGLQSFWRRAKT